MQSPQTIKDKLDAKGIDQQSVAAILGCDLSTVHCTIYGKRRNRRIANTIAVLVGEPVENLFAFAAVPPKPRKPKPARPPKPTKEEVAALRIEVRMMVDTIGTRIPRGVLAEKLEEFTGRPVNLCTLSMALSGNRITAAYVRILRDIRSMILAAETFKQNTHN
jgi:hypothetical protein